MEHRILICDDDIDILNALEIYLRQDGYDVLRAQNGRQAVDLFKKADDEIHLVLLDIMMPVMDGIATAVDIRKHSNVPIIFLSAKSEDTDRILGLNMGADDYITKPFNVVELLARVKAALRRFTRLLGIRSEKPENIKILQTGGLVVDDDKKMVSIDGAQVSLTPIEYNILLLLMKNLDRVFSSEQIYEAVWNEPAFYVSKTVSVHIRKIREKIEINPKEPQYLKVVYGLGYKVVSLK
ncbi:MAG: response regulator transcription factor [Defluviitaleaceae bacterium]|nr:response regulator transcription factor [Defluviitaleaceae bacterium]